MKNIYKIYLSILSVFVLMNSCELVAPLDDVDVSGRIPIEEAYNDKAIIDRVLLGTYASVRNLLPISGVLSGMSVSGQENAYGSGGLAYLNNNIVISNRDVLSIYSGGYRALDNANEIIKRIPNTSDDVLTQEDKNIFIGEAKFVRALSHFYLLRTFGQFYDLNSEYGIILGPVELDAGSNPVAAPRNTVQEVYTSILQDLDDALNSGISNDDVSRATMNNIKALKAKVLLFMGRYEEAKTIASEFLSLELTEGYKEVFVNAHKSSDVLFASATDFDNSNSFGGGYAAGIAIGSEYVNELHTIENDTIRDSPIDLFAYPLPGFKWDFDNNEPPAWMHLRIPEILLIYAEAETRVAKANGGTIADVTEGITQLNKIRARVDLLPKAPTTLDEFLTIIREEKIMELYYENGEDWFDLIRYDREGDLNIEDIKPSVDNANKYILPIPENEIEIGKGVIKQNPGYDS